MNSRVLTLVKSWLVIDFFGESRKTGEPGSSLTSTIFTQSFIGLFFAAVFLPDFHGIAVAYLAANLSLSTGLIGIGMLGEPKRQKREEADELLVRTAPMPAGSLTLARALHSSFSLTLVTTGMAIPPAILAYWACGFSLVAIPLYLLMATVVAAFMAAALAIFTRFVFLTMGPARSQLVAGTLKATLLAGGLVGFAICLPHLDKTAEHLPIGRTGAMMWPPYWAARVIDRPLDAGFFWLLLAGLALVLFVAAMALNSMQRNRIQKRAKRPGILSAVDRALTRDGPLLGITRFIATMLFRSPGFRARVLPLFGIPAGMVMLSLWDTQDPRAQALLLGMTLQAPAIGMPFLVTFLPRSDHENAGWIFRTSPHRDMRLYRTASLVALTTHVLLPVQIAACLGLLAASSWSLSEVLFAVTMPLFSLGLGVFVTEICLTRLTTAPFTNDSDMEEGAMEFGGLTALAIILALFGGAFSMLAANPYGILIAAALLGAAIHRLRGNCRVALTT